MTEAEKTALYEEYQPKVQNYLYAKLSNHTDAEDLCADVFLKVFANIDRFDSTKASVSTWIFTIARNTLFDKFRTMHQTAELDEMQGDGTDFVEDIVKEEELSELAEALKKLPEKERDLILLHYYGDATLKDTATRMGISYSYAKVLHTNALKKLKELMGNY